MRHLLPLILVLATCWASKPIFESVPPQPIQDIQDDYKLPDNVKPTNYVIELTPHLNTGDNKNFTFEGKSEIDLEVHKPTKTITFHAKNINITKIVLTYTNPDKNSTNDTLDKKFILDEEKDFVIANLTNEITNQMKNVKLTLSYTGVLNDELRGFYRSSYQIEKETRWLATTHFEPVGARQAFPCWDEPALKATFQITINVPDKYDAVSNTPKNVKESKDKRIVFERTQKMSTYLVAFVVSDYKRVNETKELGVWTKPNAIDSAKFAVKIGQETLKKLDAFTGIKYYDSMKKMDQISIPDFAAGAMENWGLVTYRESALLYTENKTTTQDKQSIATVIVHEFAHQWFGNLVTCEWWDYIWLNEGFASFFQYYTTEEVIKSALNETWRLMDQFVIKNVQASAFVSDASINTRSLNSEKSAKTPAQISSLFDDIAYQKGASILRMLQQFLTEDVFKAGLQNYLKKNAFKPVNPKQLFDAIIEAKSEEVKKSLPINLTLNDVMENWLKKPGYPVVTVTRIANSNKVNLTQERFFLKPTEKDAADKTKWYIPLTYVTNQTPNNVISFWMTNQTTQERSIDKLNNETWILFNKNQTGYYRVNYDLQNWNLLATYLKGKNYTNITSTNRAQLIDDALNLARAGLLSYKPALQITLYLLQEVDYIPWYAAVRAFNYLDIVLQNTTFHEKFHIYVARKIKAFADEVNYKVPNGTHVTKLGKVLALDTACKYGEKDCENFAKQELEKWLNDKEEKIQLPIDLRSAIICAGLRNADLNTWKKALERYNKSTDNDERTDILIGLGCAKSEQVIQHFLNSTITKNPAVDTFSAIYSIFAGNVQSFNILLDFINDQIETITKGDENKTQLAALLNKLATGIINIDQYGKLALLAYEHLHTIEKITALYQAMENVAWKKFYEKEVEDWVQENWNQDDSSASSFTLTSFLVLIPILLARFN